jgi:hypothetical protein
MTEQSVWLMPPFGQGEPKEIEAKPDILVPLLVAGWRQCDPPAKRKDANPHVDD